MPIIIIGVTLLLLFVVGCDFCEKRSIGPVFVQKAGYLFFATYRRAMIGIGFLMLVWLAEYFVLEFGPEYEWSGGMVVFVGIEIYLWVSVLIWVDMRFHPVQKREDILGEHLVEVAIEKSKSLVALEEFFEGLVNGFEGQPERSGTAHYDAAKGRFLLRDDKIGTVFKQVLSKWISEHQELR